MKKKTKWIIAICVIAVVALGLVLAVGNAQKMAENISAAVQTRSLDKMTLADTVNVTGTVESKESSNVYSPLASLQVKTIFVSVGDKVSAGDNLCELNTDTMEKDYEQSEASLDASQSAAQQQIQSSQEKYDNAVSNLNNGLNAQVNSANAAVTSAQTAKSRADQAYYNARDAKDAAAAKLKEEEEKSPPDPAAVAAAQAAYDQAEQAEKAASSATYDAQKAYENALKQQSVAQNAANQEIEAYRQALQSAKTAANSDSQEIGLEKLQLQLDNAMITAPISGTVTAVNAVEGGSSTGILFVIDNTDDLQIATTIKEYDVNRVRLGMAATIQSDGTGDDIYDGKLSSIAPAAVQSSSSGASLTAGTASSSDVKFDAVLDVVSRDTKLRIGMNTRVDIILDQKDDVFAVPYDAVTQNAAGETVVYALTTDESGGTSFQEIPVFTGMETDFYIEISGKDLKDGMQIVSNPDSIPSLNLPSRS